MNQEPLVISYHFSFGPGKEKRFRVELDRDTLALRPAPAGTLPEWTRLENFRCSTCPLPSGKHTYCPLAVNICGIVDFLNEYRSFQEVEVTVDAEERRYCKKTQLQEGASSLLGIYLVTCGCPVLGKLRPMVRYHLPFATLEETCYRAASMYLLAQHFAAEAGKEADLAMRNLPALYDEIATLNREICDRLYRVNAREAIFESLIHLDCFATSVGCYPRFLDQIRPNFAPLLA